MFPENVLFSRQYVNGSHNIFEILAEMRSETTCAFPETEQSTSETANQSCREATKTIPHDRDPEINFPTHRTYKKRKKEKVVPPPTSMMGTRICSLINLNPPGLHFLCS